MRNHQSEITNVESKMGNMNLSEKIKGRSGREREKENGAKNVENERSRSGDRDAAKKKNRVG